MNCRIRRFAPIQTDPLAPAEVKARHPAIPWREMAAAGNLYRRDYDQVAVRRVWHTLQLALPPVRAVIEEELGSLDAP